MWISNVQWFCLNISFCGMKKKEELLWRHFGCQLKCTITHQLDISLWSVMFLPFASKTISGILAERKLHFGIQVTHVLACTQKQRGTGKMCIHVVLWVWAWKNAWHLILWKLFIWPRLYKANIIYIWFRNDIETQKKPREDIGDFSLYVPFSRSLIPAVYIYSPILF